MSRLVLHRFLGKGLTYPLQTDPNNGELSIAAGVDNVKSCLRFFFDTVLGERILNEGIGLPNILFENVGRESEDIVKDVVYNRLPTYEPRIRVLSMTSEDYKSQGGMSGVRYRIYYRIKATSQEDNIVFEPYSTDEVF